MYGELRLDLPGDQRQAVGEFLSKFPGFADQAALEAKLDEVLDQLVKDASKGNRRTPTNIKPWFDGELGLQRRAVARASKITLGPDGHRLRSGPRAAVGQGRRGAQAWFDAAFKETGRDDDDRDLRRRDRDPVRARRVGDGRKAAFAIVDGKVAVAGDVASVKAAVDTKETAGSPTRPVRRPRSTPPTATTRLRLRRASAVRRAGQAA